MRVIVRVMQLPAIREEEERRSLIQDKEEEEEDMLINEPMKKEKKEEEQEEGGTIIREMKEKAFPLQEIWRQFDKQEEAEGQELIKSMVRGGRGEAK